ncbi:MAG: hypothetical protein U9Q82_04285 [Chloroflexota bacterium]|nr:hypothetical protein [Chloroflexota bacterium]
MDFERLLTIVADEPLFESDLLLAGEVNPQSVRVQLTRWKNSGRLYQLRRGLYALAPPYRKIKPHPFVVANRILRASYVSCQSALAFYNLIPENVPRTISLTGGRASHWETPLGVYHYHHIKTTRFRGYRLVDLGGGQEAFVATPEKALLDLVYLQPQGDSPAYLAELRLQNLEKLDMDELRRQAGWFEAPKMRRAVEQVTSLAQDEREYELL